MRVRPLRRRLLQWLEAAGVLFAPLVVLVLFARSYDADEAMLELMAGALPALYVLQAGRVGGRTDLARAASAALLVALGLGAIAEAGAWGLFAAIPAALLAAVLLVTKRESPPKVAGLLAISAVVLAVVTVHWWAAVGYDRAVIIGASVIAIGCVKSGRSAVRPRP